MEHLPFQPQLKFKQVFSLNKLLTAVGLRKANLPDNKVFSLPGEYHRFVENPIYRSGEYHRFVENPIYRSGSDHSLCTSSSVDVESSSELSLEVNFDSLSDLDSFLIESVSSLEGSGLKLQAGFQSTFKLDSFVSESKSYSLLKDKMIFSISEPESSSASKSNSLSTLESNSLSTLESNSLSTLESNSLSTLESDSSSTLESDSSSTLESDSLSTLESNSSSTLESDSLSTLESDSLSTLESNSSSSLFFRRFSNYRRPIRRNSLFKGFKITLIAIPEEGSELEESSSDSSFI